VGSSVVLSVSGVCLVVVGGCVWLGGLALRLMD
jgi:hypothetical protein